MPDRQKHMLAWLNQIQTMARFQLGPIGKPREEAGAQLRPGEGPLT